MKKFLVCGCYKSGTTFLSRNLNSHSRILCTCELDIFNDYNTFECYITKVFNDADYAQHTNLAYKIHHVKLFKEFQNGNIDKSTFFNIIERVCQVEWYGDKNPFYVFNLDILQKYVDAAIFIVRNPIEVIYLRQKQFPELIVEDFTQDQKIHSWYKFTNSWDQIKNALSIPYCELHYGQEHALINSQKLSQLLEVDLWEIKRNYLAQFVQTSIPPKDYETIAKKIPDSWKSLIEKYCHN